MRLSYHGWAALLLVMAFVLVAGGIALGIAPTSVDKGDGNLIACGFPWAPSGAAPVQCAVTFGARGTLGLVSVLSGALLFGGTLLVGMLVAGVRDAVAGKSERAGAPPTS